MLYSLSTMLSMISSNSSDQTHHPPTDSITVPFCMSCLTWLHYRHDRPSTPLLRAHITTHFVVFDFVPVDLGSCDRQSTSQSLECGVTHCLVASIQSGLVALFN